MSCNFVSELSLISCIVAPLLPQPIKLSLVLPHSFQYERYPSSCRTLSNTSFVPVLRRSLFLFRSFLLQPLYPPSHPPKTPVAPSLRGSRIQAFHFLSFGLSLFGTHHQVYHALLSSERGQFWKHLSGHPQREVVACLQCIDHSRFVTEPAWRTEQRFPSQWLRGAIMGQSSGVQTRGEYRHLTIDP